MNYLKIEKCSIENGLGVRVVLWVSGCSIHCPGCHNQETWDFDAGRPFDANAMEKLFEFAGRKWIKGITLTGGHPLEENEDQLRAVANLLCLFRDKFDDKDVWLYTGRTLSDSDFAPSPPGIHRNWTSTVLSLCDVVVDGPYVESERDITLAFRGSRNQRIIDVQKTIDAKQIVEIQIE